MPRRPRDQAGGFVYHVLNRAVGRGTVFEEAVEKLNRDSRPFSVLLDLRMRQNVET